MTRRPKLPERRSTMRARRSVAGRTNCQFSRNRRFFATRNWAERAEINAALVPLKSEANVLTALHHQIEVQSALAGRITEAKAKITALEVAMSLRIGALNRARSDRRRQVQVVGREVK